MNVHDLPVLELAAPGPEREMPECGNRGRGDRRLGLSKPTISKDLRVLEEQAETAGCGVGSKTYPPTLDPAGVPSERADRMDRKRAR